MGKRHYFDWAMASSLQPVGHYQILPKFVVRHYFGLIQIKIYQNQILYLTSIHILYPNPQGDPQGDPSGDPLERRGLQLLQQLVILRPGRGAAACGNATAGPREFQQGDPVLIRGAW